MASVLIVDDDKHTRALLRTIFEQDPRFSRHALAVHEAADGVEGLMLFDQHRPEIVITDLLMPRMDGFKLCQALRDREHGKKTGLVVVSGVYREPTSLQKLQTEHGALCFQKPYQLSELAVAVDRLLGGTRKSEIVGAVPQEDAAGEGTLDEQPLPRLLFDLLERRATGMLEIRRAKVEKRIDLVMGHPVSVSSNQRNEALGAFLMARGTITVEQQQQALRRASESGGKLGEALVELGVLSAAQLVKALTAQARAKITSALRWTGGTWKYTPNRDLLDRHKGNALDPVMVVLLGLKQTAHLDESMRAVDAIGGRPIVLSPRGERARETIKRVFGDTLLEALARPASVAAVLEAWPDAAAVMQALEALLVTGCATAHETAAAAKPAATTPPANPPPPVSPRGTVLMNPPPPEPARPPAKPAKPAPAPAPKADPIALRGLATSDAPAPSAARAAGRATAPKGKSSLRFDDLFGEDLAQVEMDASRALAAPLAAAAAAQVGATPPAPPPPARALDGVVPEHVDDEESGVIEVFGSLTGTEQTAAGEAREALLGEYLRVQGADPYDVLGLSRGATPEAIEAAYAKLQFDLSLERFAAFDLGPDHGKLEEVHAAYRRAHEILLDPIRRAELDARTTGPAEPSPALVGELSYNEGQRLLAQGDVDGALAAFRRALSAVPDAADYHAALGWALHRKGVGGDGAGTSPAIVELELALAIDPDHAAAHEYLGRLLAERGKQPDKALRHLERALASRPPRLDAVAALAELRVASGEPQLGERQYRLLIHASGDADRAAALRLWVGLAELYRGQLGDPESARTAFGAAARLAPDDPAIARALDELTAGKPELWDERVEALRARVRLEPGDPAPARALAEGALAAGQWDLAWIAAALAAARDPDLADAPATDGVATWYRRFRLPFLPRAHERVHPDALPGLRHPDDEPGFERLFARLDGLLDELAPIAFDDLGADAPLAHADVPEPVARVRAYLARLLDVPPPDIAPCPAFAEQAHVGAPSGRAPLLVVGPDALGRGDTVALGFQLARAMTYLWPGRAAAGARPARLLRSVVLGCASVGGPGVAPVTPDPADRVAAAARAWLLGAAESVREDVRRALAVLMHARTNLNLSAWLRAMARTADRVALLVCGDPVVALRAVDAMSGAEAAHELATFVTSQAHLAARAALGLRIDV